MILEEASTPPRRPVHKWIRLALGVTLLVGLAVVARHSVLRGRALQRTAPEIFLGAAPLVGRNFRDGWDWRFNPTQLIAAGFVIVVAASWWSGWWLRARTGLIIGASAVGAGLFAVVLALTDGRDGLLHGAADKSEYFANLGKTPDAGKFVSSFLRRISLYSVHVRGHPPGFTVLLKFIDAIGLHGVWPVVGLSVLGTVLLPIGVLLTVRTVVDERTMRSSAPFLIVAPYSIWMMTSADALYTGAGACGIALIVVGTRTTGRRAVLCGLSGGLLLGADLYGTYLVALLFVVPSICLAASLRSHRGGTLAAGAAAMVGGLVVVGLYKWSGFWWFDGVDQTKREYWAGSAQFRTWGYFGIANLIVAVIAVGPASVVGAWRLRNRRLWLLVGAGLTALAISHLSQYTKGEVERIWLLFYPWIALAGAGLAGAGRAGTGRAGTGLAGAGRARPDLENPLVEGILVANSDGERPILQPERGDRSAAIWIAIQGGAAIVLQAALLTKW